MPRGAKCRLHKTPENDIVDKSATQKQEEEGYTSHYTSGTHSKPVPRGAKSGPPTAPEYNTINKSGTQAQGKERKPTPLQTSTPPR